MITAPRARGNQNVKRLLSCICVSSVFAALVRITALSSALLLLWYFLLLRSSTAFRKETDNPHHYGAVGTSAQRLLPLLRQAALPSRAVIVTTVNGAYLPLLSLFVSQLKRVRMKEGRRNLLASVVVLCFDRESYRSCSGIKSLHCYLDEQAGAVLEGEKTYRSHDYLTLVWRKVELQREVLAAGFHLLFTDVDVLWFQDPFPYLEGPEDIKVTCDHFDTNSTKASLNSGFFFAKSNKQTIDFFDYRIRDHAVKFPNMTEQDVWWRLRPEVDEHTANKIGLTINYLPTSQFATYCEEPKSREALAKVVTFHGNCKLRLRFKLVNLSYTIQYRDDAVAEFGLSP